MKIGIIGAGFTGLAAAWSLSRQGHSVVVFESADLPGGLAAGFKETHWSWPLEKHYHHLFVSDRVIRQLASRIGARIDYSRPKSSTFYKGSDFQLDSPISLLRFPHLSFPERLRTGLGLAALKALPFGSPLEQITAKKYITAVMGLSSWEVLWEPLFTGKFGREADKISAVWFWARVFKRSPELGYPSGGFLSLAQSVAKAAAGQGARFSYRSRVNQISSDSRKTVLNLVGGGKVDVDAVICTLPSVVFAGMCSDLPAAYRRQLISSRGLGAVNLVLSLKYPLLTDGTYWLNINDRELPFLAVVEHTNFVDPAHYGGDRLVYVGNYVPAGHPYFSATPDELLAKFAPGLKKINPDFSVSWVKRSWVWQAGFAQPLVPIGYAKTIPPLNTPLPRVYLANIQQVYPWDRGVNYAVELGYRVSDRIVSDLGSK